MSLNSEQKQYVEYLHSLRPQDKCWCGWYRKEECGSWCNNQGKGLTCADKLALQCSECHNYPWEPGGQVTHNIKCSKAIPK